MENEKKLVYTVDEMRKALGISKPTAYALVRRPDFPAIRISERRIVVPCAASEEYLRRTATGEG